MNYLELCQKVRQEAGISGSGPASVTGQTGVYQKIVGWVDDAYTHIQRLEQSWNWKWSEYTFDTQADVSDHLLTAVGMRTWKTCDINIYKTSEGKADENKIPYIKYCDWKTMYGTGVVPSSRPVCYTVTPDNKLRLAPAPDGIYTVTGEGFTSEHNLVDNIDEHTVPPEYELAIVYLAMEYWAMDQEAEQERQYAEKEYKKQMSGMRRDYLPKFSYGYEALA
jgi:hypothetical protein